MKARVIVKQRDLRCQQLRAQLSSLAEEVLQEGEHLIFVPRRELDRLLHLLKEANISHGVEAVFGLGEKPW